tara:strand:+ start:1332 stop:3914 length:2583 start_codon:yes stop_codon:yes gene_type:complete
MSNRSNLVNLAKEAEKRNDKPTLDKILLKLANMPAETPSPVQPDTSESVMTRNEDPNLDVNVSGPEFGVESAKRGVMNSAEFLTKASLYMSPLSALVMQFAGGKYNPGKAGDEVGKFISDKLESNPNMRPPDKLSAMGGDLTQMAVETAAPSGVLVRGAKAGQKLQTAATELAATVGATAGSQAGGEIAEGARGDRSIGHGIGSFTGSLPAASVTGLARSMFKGKEALGSVMHNKAGQRIKGIVDAEELPKKIEESNEIIEAINKVTGKKMEPTLAGRTGSEILGNLEQKVLGADIETAEKVIKQHKTNAEIVGEFFDKKLGSPKTAGGKNLSLPGIAGNRVRKSTLSIREAARDVATQRALLLKKSGGDDIGKQQPIGKELRATRDLNKQRESTKLTDRLEGKDGIYQQAKAEGLTANMNQSADLVDAIAKGDKDSFQNMPSVFKKVSEARGKSSSFKTLHSLYRETNRELTIATRAGSPSIGHLTDLKKQLKSQIDGFESGGSKAATDFKKWNEDYGVYSKNFKEGSAGKMGAGNRFGERVSDDEIIKNFFTPEGVDNFKQVYGNNKYAEQRLEDGILDLFAKESGMSKGDFKPSAFLSKHAETLKKLPKLKAKLHNSEKAAGLLLTRATRLAEAEKQISRGILGKLAKSTDVDKVIDEALTDPKYMRELMTTGPEGRQAVVHALSTAIPRAAAKKGVTIGKYMDENETMLRQVLNRHGKEHYNNVRTAMRATDMLIAGPPPSHPSLTFLNQDPIEALTGTTGPSLLSQYRATYITRQSSPTHMAATSATRLWMRTIGRSSKHMQEYLLTHPDAARDFALASKSKTIGRFAPKINKHLLAAGIRASISDQEDVMRKDK